MVGNAVKHVGEVRLGIEAVQARRADQAIHRSCAFAASVGAGEQVVAPPNRDATQRSFSNQVVDLCAPVAAVVDQRRPVVQRILDVRQARVHSV